MPVTFMAIRGHFLYLWSFGNSVSIRYIFTRFGMLYHEKSGKLGVFGTGVHVLITMFCHFRQFLVEKSLPVSCKPVT
jgi:hypothetical protein